MRQDMLPEQPLGSLYRSRAVRASHVALEKFLNDVVDTVGLGCAGEELLAARVATLADGAQCFAGKSSGRLQIDCGVATEGVLARLAVVPVPDRPRSRPARLDDKIQARHMAVGDLTPVGAGAHALDGFDGQAHEQVPPRPQ